MPTDSVSSTQVNRTLRISGIMAAIAAVAIVVTGVTSRANDNEKLQQWTSEQAIPSVSVVVPLNGGSDTALELPGRFQAYARAPIYARVDGYLKNWKTDIGTRVKAGQLLAEIETPDLDQQLLQSRADLASAQANAALAETTANRWQALANTDAVSRQEVDDKTADLLAKQAMVKAAEATVNRLLAMKRFARIVAPFAGTVTARNTDTGALINAGDNGSPLFEISDTRKLRLYINVPQNYAGSIAHDTKTEIRVPEHPDKTYTAQIQSFSGSVDAASGTTLVQLSVDNAMAELMPGGYAHVSLQLAGNPEVLSIPASALIVGRNGPHVATVTPENKVMLKRVTIVRDLGKTIALGTGINKQDRIIETPPDGVGDGDSVQVVTSEPASKSKS